MCQRTHNCRQARYFVSLPKTSYNSNIDTGKVMQPGTCCSSLLDDVRIYGDAVRP